MAQALTGYLADSPDLPNIPVFPHMPKNLRGAKMVKADLAATSAKGKAENMRVRRERTTNLPWTRAWPKTDKSRRFKPTQTDD